jgi:hypothetical protein
MKFVTFRIGGERRIGVCDSDGASIRPISMSSADAD